VVTDPDARLPEFLHWVHKHVAKCINASYGRWENLWASEAPSAVRLEDDDDVLDKIAYTLANPVSAALVERGTHWPGLRTAPAELAGHTIRVERPPVFFREHGPMSEAVTLRIVRPAGHAERTDRELAQLVAPSWRNRPRTGRTTPSRDEASARVSPRATSGFGSSAAPPEGIRVRVSTGVRSMEARCPRRRIPRRLLRDARAPGRARRRQPTQIR
jgi:hypothetical protein